MIWGTRTRARRALLPALGSALVALVAGASQAQSVKLDLWFGEDDQALMDAMNQSVAQFNQAHPDIQINVIQKGASSGFEEPFLVAEAAGAGPDLVYMNSSFILQQSLTSNVFLPISDLAPAGTFDKMDWLEGLKRDFTTGGKWWGVPFRGAARGFFINEALVAQAGLPPESGPELISDLDDWAAKLTKRGADGSIDQLGFAPNDNNYLQGLPWLWVFGGEYYDAERSRPEFAAVPQNLEAMQWIAGYAERYGATASAKNKLFETGKVALHIDSTSALARWQSNPDLNFTVTKIPHQPGIPSISYIGGQGLAIPRGSKDPQAALQFLLYLAQPDVQANWYREAGSMPARLEAIRLIGGDLRDPRERPIFDMLSDARTRVPLSRTLEDAFQQIADQMRQGKLTPQAALARLDAVTTPEYQKVFG